MDEARRFLRYVMPGLVFAVESLLLLWILVPSSPLVVFDLLKEDRGLGVAVASFLVSGGLGFLFSTVHHWLNWRFDSVLNHGKFVRRLISSKLVDFYDSRDQIITAEESQNLTREQCWAILTSLWHERADQGPLMSATPRATGLTDLTHSLGSVRVASYAAPVFVAAIVGNRIADISNERAGLAFILSLLLMFVHESSYRRAGRLAQRFIEQTLADTLVREHESPTGASIRSYLGDFTIGSFSPSPHTPPGERTTPKLKKSPRDATDEGSAIGRDP